MSCSRPEFPQAAAYFSGPDNPDLHSISSPIVLLKVLCAALEDFGAAAMVRSLSVVLLPVPNTFFQVLALLLPMAWEPVPVSVLAGNKGRGSGGTKGVWRQVRAAGEREGRSVQKLAPMIMRPDLIEDEKDDQCADDRQDYPGRMK
jgi:hypothetical protein